MKPHYPILDGLRGTAAILVIIFHIIEAHFHDFGIHPIHHGYLAVDFFFLLSGFVVAYAYDDRWARMSLWEFFKIRLIRLHPLVILGAAIGAIGFVLDPYTNGFVNVGYVKLFGVMLWSFTLLPSPDIRGWGETHSLDGPAWSLFQEYIANVIYGVFGRKMSGYVLGGIVAISAVTLALTATGRPENDIATGWSYATFWIGFNRMTLPFFAGLLLFRTGKLIRIPMAYLLCSLALIVLFMLPKTAFNGYYEVGCILFIFPIIVAAGAGSDIEGRWAKLCKFSGDISYPLYITHYPFIYVYTAWVETQKPSAEQAIPIACGVFVVSIAVAYAALKLYDEPVRAWLKAKFLSAKA
jgi:peptidoglycan/LPS O-acetylase OafA/YrhL